MEGLTVDRRLAAFRAADAFTIEIYRAAGSLRRSEATQDLTGELRRNAVRSGAALVAASASRQGGETERGHLLAARVALIESRYYLYLARRFGVLDARRYRGLTLRLDAALRELDAILERSGRRPADPAPREPR